VTQKKGTVRRAILGEKLMNKRKIGRFIYFFSGIAFPFLIGPFFVFACQFPKLDYEVLSYSLVVLISHIHAGKIATKKKFNLNFIEG